jgi:hypothetical protein
MHGNKGLWIYHSIPTLYLVFTFDLMVLIRRTVLKYDSAQYMPYPAHVGCHF